MPSQSTFSKMIFAFPKLGNGNPPPLLEPRRQCPQASRLSIQWAQKKQPAEHLHIVVILFSLAVIPELRQRTPSRNYILMVHKILYLDTLIHPVPPFQSKVGSQPAAGPWRGSRNGRGQWRPGEMEGCNLRLPATRCLQKALPRCWLTSQTAGRRQHQQRPYCQGFQSIKRQLARWRI